MRSGIIYAAVAALCLGAVSAQGGARATSTLVLGSVSEVTPQGVAVSRAKLTEPGMLMAGLPNYAIATVEAAPGFEAIANAEGASLAEVSIGDSYGDASGLGYVHILGSATVDSYGAETAQSNLEAVTETDQSGNGAADAGAAGDAQGVVEGEYYPSTAANSYLQAGIARSRPGFVEVGFRGADPYVYSTTDTPGSSSQANLILDQIACADIYGDCEESETNEK